MIRLVSSRFDLFRFVWSRLVSFLFLGVPRDWDSLFANSGDEDGLDRGRRRGLGLGLGLGLGRKDLVGLGEENPGGGARVDQSILFFLLVSVAFLAFFLLLLK